MALSSFNLDFLSHTDFQDQRNNQHKNTIQFLILGRIGNNALLQILNLALNILIESKINQLLITELKDRKY